MHDSGCPALFRAGKVSRDIPATGTVTLSAVRPTDQKAQELTISQFATLLYKGNIYAPTPQPGAQHQNCHRYFVRFIGAQAYYFIFRLNILLNLFLFVYCTRWLGFAIWLLILDTT